MHLNGAQCKTYSKSGDRCSKHIKSPANVKCSHDGCDNYHHPRYDACPDHDTNRPESKDKVKTKSSKPEVKSKPKSKAESRPKMKLDDVAESDVDKPVKSKSKKQKPVDKSSSDKSTSDKKSKKQVQEVVKKTAKLSMDDTPKPRVSKKKSDPQIEELPDSESSSSGSSDSSDDDGRETVDPESDSGSCTDSDSESDPDPYK